MSWLYNAIHHAVKPKHSIIQVLKLALGGPRQGRSMAVLHASDVTKVDFCPRKWALFDLFEKPAPDDYVGTAMAVTYAMGLETERLLVEEWAGTAVVGNWRCRHCGDQRSMVPKPQGYCKPVSAPSVQKHWWQHMQMVIDAPEYGISGAPDALFDVGAPQLVVTEIKTMNPVEFDGLLTPLPEHRLRTNLYMKLIDHSQHPWRNIINVQEARVLYVSRGYGKMNAEWNEILPFKEYVVKRNDHDLTEFLKRAVALKEFRAKGFVPYGICSTALDKVAKKCSVVQPCFSGQYMAGKTPPPPEG